MSSNRQSTRYLTHLDTITQPSITSSKHFLRKEEPVNRSTISSIVRKIDDCTSIRKGKYGDYVFYKKHTTYNDKLRELFISYAGIKKIRK